MQSTVFIYHKGYSIKVLELDDPKSKHELLIECGWKHTATLNAALWIEELYKTPKVDDILIKLNSLTK